MDKIWDRNSFEVGGHWPLWRGGKKRMTTQNRQKSNAKKNRKTTVTITKYTKAIDTTSRDANATGKTTRRKCHNNDNTIHQSHSYDDKGCICHSDDAKRR